MIVVWFLDIRNESSEVKHFYSQNSILCNHTRSNLSITIHEFLFFLFLIKWIFVADKLIGIHCTHGVNRTGFFVCAYMVLCLNMKPNDALKCKFVCLMISVDLRLISG